MNFIFYSAVFQIKNIYIFQKGYRSTFENYFMINLGMYQFISNIYEGEVSFSDWHMSK